MRAAKPASQRYDPMRPEGSENVFVFPVPGDPELQITIHKWQEDGRLLDLVLQVRDTRDGTLLASIDCKHGTIHRHNETESDRPRKELFPLATQDELQKNADEAIREVAEYAKDLKARRGRK